MSRGSDLTPDCGRCTGLCCMAFAFEPSPEFPIDKPAGEPCPHLRGDFGCAVHEDRARRGFHGCIAFTCLGAGQRISAEVFPGADWRGDAALRDRMIEAFRALREIHRLLELLRTARALPLPPAMAAERAALEEALDPAEGWNEAALARFEDSDLPGRVAGFLAGLRDHAPASQRQRARRA